MIGSTNDTVLLTAPEGAPFKRGDIIRQRHVQAAPDRLVVGFTFDPKVVTVLDPLQDRLINTLTWGHELVHPSDADTLQSADEALNECRTVGGVIPQ